MSEQPYSPELQQPEVAPSIHPPTVSSEQTLAAPTNTLAIVSLVLVLIPPVFILGIVFGHVALHQIKQSGAGGRGLALTALWLGYILLAITIASFIALAVAFTALSAGRG